MNRSITQNQQVHAFSNQPTVVICFVSTNRGYHLAHPELHLEASQTVLIVWTTLVCGVIATAWHFLGWSLALLGSAGWSTGRVPRALCIFYWVAGAASIFVYLLPDQIEGLAVLLCVAVSIWQGFLLWRTWPGDT